MSGGCVEGAVYELAQEVVSAGGPVLQRYGVSDDDAFAVGLTCGGILDVFVEPVSQETFPELGEVAADIEAGQPVAVATVIAHPDASWIGRRAIVRPESFGGSLGSERADAAIADDVRGLLAAGRTATLTYGPDGERRGEGMRVFVASYAPKPRMLVFGAIDFAAAVARQGAFLGYQVTVCDARPVFATAARFPDAHEVVVSWPHKYLQKQVESGAIDERTVICVLTHDPKFDVPLLELALRLESPHRPAFVGAMGSRRTHDDRLARLREAGVGEDAIARLSQPDRSRPRRTYARGDRGLHRRRDHRAPVGRPRRPAQRPRRPHPPRGRLTPTFPFATGPFPFATRPFPFATGPFPFATRPWQTPPPSANLPRGVPTCHGPVANGGAGGASSAIPL